MELDYHKVWSSAMRAVGMPLCKRNMQGGSSNNFWPLKESLNFQFQIETALSEFLAPSLQGEVGGKRIWFMGDPALFTKSLV